jgi:hypothetical protein
MKSSEMMFPAGIVLALAGATVWHYTTLEPLAHVAIGNDHSVSVEENCAGLREAGKALVESRPGIREGSTLSLLVMGTDVRAPDPALRWTKPLPERPKKVYGRDEEEFERKKGDLFDQFEEGCRAPEPSRRSPIYRLVKLGTAHLRSLGCGPAGRCYLLIRSDLDEHVNARLEAAIARAASEGVVEVPAELAGSIDNAGIEVAFCGIAEIRPDGQAKQATSAPETRAHVWEGLFTHPELVSFSPYCGKAAGLAPAVASD